jgi:hypothetical protein
LIGRLIILLGRDKNVRQTLMNVRGERVSFLSSMQLVQRLFGMLYSVLRKAVVGF